MTGFHFSDLLRRSEMAALLEETGAGFETIWFSIAAFLDRFDRMVAREQERQAAFGHPDLIVHGPFLDLNPAAYDSRVRQITMDRFNQAYRAAEILGAHKVVYHSCMVPSVYFLTSWSKRMVAFWDEFLDGKSGIDVCMENVLDQEIYPFAEVADGVGRDDFGLCLDVGHAHCYANHDALDWAVQLGSRIKHVHLHDNDATRDAHHGIGCGTIAWDELIPAILRACPVATWTVECPNAEEARSSFRQWKNMTDKLRD